jgi:fructokinase
MPDIICLGEALVDMVSTAQGLNLVHSPAFNKVAGGAPTNVAAGCALLGADCGLIAKVGKDHFGEFIRQTLWDAGVNLDHFLFTPAYPTQLAFVAIDERGVPDFAFHVKQSADQMLTEDDIDPAYFAQADIFHFGSITLINEPARDATLKALQVAHDAGLTISFDPNVRPPLWPSLDIARETILTVLPECDFLKVNEEEMRLLTGFEDVDRGLHALYEMGPEIVAITRGPLGCVAASATDRVDLPAFRVPIQDTTGCGDSFVAAVLTRLNELDEDISEIAGEELYDIIRFATAASGLTAAGEGAISSLPARDEVEQLLRLADGGELPEMPDEEKDDPA